MPQEKTEVSGDLLKSRVVVPSYSRIQKILELLTSN